MKKLIFLGSFLLACCEHPAAVSQSSASAQSVIPAQTDQLSALFGPRDPATATAAITDSSIGAASEGSTLKVPKLSITLDNADYFTLLRCRQDATIVSSTNKDIQKDLPTMSTADKRNVWRIATGACAHVSEHSSLTDFVDLTANQTADEQNFFYVLNPCVSSSTVANENCSYNISVAQMPPYKSTLAADFISTAESLMDTEQNLDDAFGSLKSEAHDLKVTVENCERVYVDQLMAQQAKASLFGLLDSAVSIVVGPLITGPVSAFVNTNGIVSKLAGVSNQPLPFKCDKADSLMAQIKILTERTIPPLMMQVKTARVNMNRLNAEYAPFDEAQINENR